MLLKLPWYPVRCSRAAEAFWNRAHCCHALSLYVYSVQFCVMTCSRNVCARAQPSSQQVLTSSRLHPCMGAPAHWSQAHCSAPTAAERLPCTGQSPVIPLTECNAAWSAMRPSITMCSSDNRAQERCFLRPPRSQPPATRNQRVCIAPERTAHPRARVQRDAGPGSEVLRLVARSCVQALGALGPGIPGHDVAQAQDAGAADVDGIHQSPQVDGHLALPGCTAWEVIHAAA